MNMPRTIFVFAVIFILLGIGAYFGTGAQSWTALIPAILGVLLAGAGAISLKHLKHGGHVAALLRCLASSDARSLTKSRPVLRRFGTPEPSLCRLCSPSCASFSSHSA